MALPHISKWRHTQNNPAVSAQLKPTLAAALYVS